MKSVDAGRVFEAVMVVFNDRDSAGRCDSKKACKTALFLCSVLAGGCGDTGELADVVGVGGRETTSLVVCGLAWTRATLSVSFKVLGERVGGFFCDRMDEIWTFGTFGVKSIIFLLVSRAGVVVGDVCELDVMRDGVDEEKIVNFGEFSL